MMSDAMNIGFYIVLIFKVKIKKLSSCGCAW